jgi:chemotaxis protein methyltransferase CheR
LENKLNDSDFRKLSVYIYNNFGIQLPPTKKILLESRLKSRLKATGMENYSDYCKMVLNGKNSEELIHMVDVVSTNKTDFFREPQHFDFLTQEFLPQYYSQNPYGKLKVWSAASSSGEEIYTLAMVIQEFIENHHGLDYQILGTDISTRILEKARLAIYGMDRIEVIQNNLKKKYLLRSKDASKELVRIVPKLRAHTQFTRLNLMDDIYHLPDDFDFVFCRNVLIYFDRPTQEKVINKLCKHIVKGGYLFLGHSESITGQNVPLKQIKPTIYQVIK